MATLSLKTRSTSVHTVPVEEWYEEMADEAANPETILINEENELENEMSTTTVATKAFDVKAFLKTAAVLANTESAASTNLYPIPAWLTLKEGVKISPANAFTVTAGVVKAARQVMDAISYTQRQHEVAVENLLIQELRATRVTAEVHNFGPEITKFGKELAFKGGASDAPGFNPDGFEFSAALDEATQEVDKLEAVLANGERIMGEILQWIVDNAADLELKVETGYTTRLGPIGNEIRTARMELLTPDTLLYGVQAQREFIRGIK
jgi:hypothetical protein